VIGASSAWWIAWWSGLDTGEQVREEQMSAAECQLNLYASVSELERMLESAPAVQPASDELPAPEEKETPEGDADEDPE